MTNGVITPNPDVIQSEAITYSAGFGPDNADVDTDITVSSDDFLPVNTLELTFERPTTILIKSAYDIAGSWPVQETYFTVESPVGTTTFAAKPNDFPNVGLYNNTILATKIRALNVPESQQFSLTFHIDFIFHDDSEAAGGAVGGTGTGLDELQRQIDLINQRLNNTDVTIQRQGETNSENVNNGVVNTGLQIADTATALVNATNDANDNLATQLTNSITDNINNLITSFGNAIGTTAGIPQELIDAIIAALKILIDTELGVVGTAINDNIKFGDIALSHAIQQGTATTNKAAVNQSQVLQNLLHGQYKTLNDFYNALNASDANTGLLKTLQDTVTIVGIISIYVKARLISAEVTLNQLTLSNDTPNLNDINTIVLGYFRGDLSYDAAQTDLAKYGLNKFRVDQLISSRALLLGLSDIKTALQRGIIDVNQHDTLLSQYGISLQNIELIKSVYPMLPTPSDITRMADKHIFAPDIPQIFGQNSELDDGYINEMSQWGIAEKDVRNLWASHWSLPGLQETFDMWHRGLIKDTELDVFFKLTDILPFFREKLKGLSYNLVTRVDIRRMYHVGVYTQQDVYAAYVKEGYSPKDAQDLTEFTVINDRLSEQPKAVKIRTLTEAMVVKAFKKGIITKADAVNRLATVGYLAPDASLILELETQTANIEKTVNKTQYYHDKTVSLVLSDYAKGVFSRGDARNYLITIGVPSVEADQELYYADLERITQLKSLVINHVRTAYTKGQIDKGQATNLMLNYGFGMSEIQLLFEELDIIKSLRNKELTLPQLTAIAKKGIIDRLQFAAELANMGYNDLHISWLIAETFGGQ